MGKDEGSFVLEHLEHFHNPTRQPIGQEIRTCLIYLHHLDYLGLRRFPNLSKHFRKYAIREALEKKFEESRNLPLVTTQGPINSS